ncbi:MAG: FUSC family protein [Myxococcaceae bacterium]
MKSLGVRNWLFSLNSFIAATSALGIGLWLGLPKPSWAMMTAYIVSQPLSGALGARAVHRLVGTVLGACAAVVLVPRLVNAPVLLATGVALWVACCLYFAYLDRTPRSYLFVLAGYTAAIIVFPGVSAPDLVFDTAVARVVEISLGILCAGAVHSVLFPQPVAPVVNARIDRFLADADAWALDALSGRSDAQERRDWRRLASDVAELHTLSTHLPYDTVRRRPMGPTVRALQERMSMLLPILSSVEDRLCALTADGRALDPRLSALLDDLSAWVRAGPDAPVSEARRLRKACADLVPPVDATANWNVLLTTSLARRLGEMVAAIRDCRALRNALRDPLRSLPQRLVPMIRARIRRPLHRDRSMAVLSGVAAIVSILVACAFWIATGFPHGGTTAMIAAIFASLFVTRDDPVPNILTELTFNGVAFLIGGVYLFAILPAISGFPMLVLVLAPVLLVGGALMSQPRFVGRATPFTMGMVVTLGLEQTFRPDLELFLNGVLAQVIGFVIAALSTSFIRSVGADAIAHRLLRTGWRDLARMAAPGVPPDRAKWAGLMLDRLGLLAPRLAWAPAGQEAESVDVLNDLRIGLNVVDLRRALPAVALEVGTTSETLLQGLSRHFRERSAGDAITPPPGLLDTLDRALVGFISAPSSPLVRAGRHALVGLRRALFPRAHPWESPVVQPAQMAVVCS